MPPDRGGHPASGYRNYTSGGVNNVGSNGNYWSSSPNSSDNSRNLNLNSSNLYPLNTNNRSNGFSARPVRQHSSREPEAALRVSFFRTMPFKLDKARLYAMLVKAYRAARKNERIHRRKHHPKQPCE